VEVELTGRLSDDELADHYRNAAVVVQPSSDEGFGLQPLEAMASGTPVVVTRAGAVSDVVGDCAVVCDATATSIAEGIRHALDRSAELRPAGRRRAEAMTWEASADAVLDALLAAALR
jgi:glycosyltransferase involved in cell wall biosynthesis